MQLPLSKQTIITSPSNPKIKELLRLKERSRRREKRVFIIEGLREVRLALGSRVGIRSIYFCPELISPGRINEIIPGPLENKISLFEVSRRAYSKIAYGKREEGVVAVAQEPALGLGDIELKPNPLIVVLEAVEKPGNLGAVIRTIDACGIDGLIVADPQTDIYNPNVVRASIGTLFAINVVQVKSDQAVSWLKSNRVKIVCAMPEAKLSYTSLDLSLPSAIIFGSEEKGISRLWLDNADTLASIPMRGSADSLNVSVAAAAFIFEALRQRNL